MTGRWITLAGVLTLAGCGGSGSAATTAPAASPAATAAPAATEVPNAEATEAPGGGEASSEPSEAAASAEAPAPPAGDYVPGMISVFIDGKSIGTVKISQCSPFDAGGSKGVTVMGADDKNQALVVVPAIPGQIAGTVNGHDYALTKDIKTESDGTKGTFSGVDEAAGITVSGTFSCP